MSLAVVDRVHDALVGAGVEGETAAAALCTLARFLDAPPIGRLRAAVGRTSPATVRMVDRLARAGYVQRRAGEDARASHVVLTPAGRERAGAVALARANVLEAVVAALAPSERALFADLLGRVLEGMVEAKLAQIRAGEPGSAWTCRLCDPAACGRERGACPAAAAARRASGRAGTLEAP